MCSADLPTKGRLGSSPVVLGRDQDRVLAGGRYKGAFAIPVVADTAGMGAEFKMRDDKRRAIELELLQRNASSRQLGIRWRFGRSQG